MSFFEFENHLHLFGGTNKINGLRTVFNDYHVYNPLTNSWREAKFQNPTNIRDRYLHITAVDKKDCY